MKDFVQLRDAVETLENKELDRMEWEFRQVEISMRTAKKTYTSDDSVRHPTEV